MDSGNPLDTLRLWGSDPVHPLESAYSKMAISIMEEINVTGVVHPPPVSKPVGGQGDTQTDQQRELDRGDPDSSPENGKMVSQR